MSLNRFFDSMLRAAWVLSYRMIIVVFRCLQAAESRKRLRTAAVTMLAASFVLAASACTRDPKLRAQEHLQKAEQYVQENKIDEANIEYRNAVQLDPTLAKAHLGLAKIQLSRGNLSAAYQQLQQAVKQDPENAEAQMLSVDLLVKTQNYVEAKEKAQWLVSKWPGQSLAHVVLAEALVGLGDLKGASSVLRERLEQGENENPRIWFDLGVIQLKQKQFAEAEASLRKAAALMPASPVPVVVLSTLFESRGDQAAAEGVLKEAAGKNDSRSDFQYLLAMYYLRHERAADAEPLFHRIQERAGTNHRLRGILAQFYVATNRIPEAEAELKRITEQDSADWLNRRKLAELYFQTNRREEAKKIADQVIEGSGQDVQALILRGLMDTEDNQIDRAITYLQRAQKLAPESPLPYLYMANAYARSGEMQQARSAVDEALRRDPEYLPARLLRAELGLRSGSVETAIEDLNRATQKQPNLFESQLLLSQAYAMRGELDRADGYVSGLMDRGATPQLRYTMLQTATRIKLSQKKYEEAAKLAMQTLEGFPQSEDALQALGAAYLLRQQPAQALQAVQAHVGKHPDWPRGLLIQGQIAMAGKLYPAAVQAFTQAAQTSPKMVDAELGLAEAYLAQNRISDARSAYERAAAMDAKNGFSRFRLAQILETEGKWQEAMKAYEQALSLDSANVAAKNNLAWLYATRNGNLDIALKLAQEAKEKRPDDPNIADTLAWILVKKGVYDGAIDQLTKSTKLLPKNASMRYHLGTAYFNTGRYREAKQNLELGLSLDGNHDEAKNAKQMLASIASR